MQKIFLLFICTLFSIHLSAQTYREKPGISFDENNDPWGFSQFGIIDRLDNRIMPDKIYAIFNHNDNQWMGGETRNASVALLSLMNKLGIKTVYHQNWFTEYGQTLDTAFFTRKDVNFSLYSPGGENRLRYENMRIGVFSGGQFENCFSNALANTVSGLKSDFIKIYIVIEATYVFQFFTDNLYTTFEDAARIQAGWWDVYLVNYQKNSFLKRNWENNRSVYPLTELINGIGPDLFYKHFEKSVLMGRMQESSTSCIDPKSSKCNLSFTTHLGGNEIGKIGNGKKNIHFIFVPINELEKMLQKDLAKIGK